MTSIATLRRRRLFFLGSATQPIRDADVIDAVIAALRATRAFSEVAWGEIPERHGRSADMSALATVEPTGWTEIDLWDSEPASDELGYEHQGTFTIVLYSRHNDPRIRDRRLDRLLSFAENAVNGKSFGLPLVGDKTILKNGRYSPASHPERRMTVQGEYSFLVDGSTSHSTET